MKLFGSQIKYICNVFEKEFAELISVLSATEVEPVRAEASEHVCARMTDTSATAAGNTGTGAAGVAAMTRKGPAGDRSHPVRLYVERVASQDIEDYPEWDLAVRIVIERLLASSARRVSLVFSTTHTHTRLTALSGTTRVSQYQKGKTNLDFTEARDST